MMIREIKNYNIYVQSDFIFPDVCDVKVMSGRYSGFTMPVVVMLMSRSSEAGWKYGKICPFRQKSFGFSSLR